MSWMAITSTRYLFCFSRNVELWQGQHTTEPMQGQGREQVGAMKTA